MQKKYLLDVIISDNSCLSVLVDSGYLNILNKLGKKIIITPEVLNEYKIYNKEWKKPEWINIDEAKDKQKKVEIGKKLGLGESSSIALAIETKDNLLISDDQKAVKYAEREKLVCTGTAGLMAIASQYKIIKGSDKAKEMVYNLKNNGLYIDDKVMKEVIEKIDLGALNLMKYEIIKNDDFEKKLNGNNIKIIEELTNKFEHGYFDKILKLKYKKENLYSLEYMKPIGNNKCEGEIFYFDRNFSLLDAKICISQFKKSDKYNNYIKNINTGNNGGNSGRR